MKSLQQEQLRVAAEASQWLEQVEEGGAQSHAAFARWLSQSPEHVEAVLKVAAVQRLVKGAPQALDVSAWIQAARRTVVPLTVGESPRMTAPATGWKRASMGWGLAAALVILVGTGLLLAGVFTRSSYTTGIGELKTVRLSDGSTVSLSTRSRIKLNFSDTARDLTLEGEALFKVQRDPARPFRVHGGPAVIQAVGTEFNVHRRPSRTVVSVLEGAVLTESAQRTVQLAAGQEAYVDRSGDLEQHPLPSRGVGGWEPRRIFNDDRLEDIVAEFNRWNERQMSVADASLAARRYSGAFNADRPESFIGFLRGDARVMFEEQRNRVTIRWRE